MRTNTMISLIAGTALLSTACGKKEAERGPEPATAQVSAPEPSEPITPEVPSEPDKDRAAPDELRGPANRSNAIQGTLSAMERGAFAEAFKYFADDVVWTEVGLPDGEITSIPKLIDFEQRTRTGFSDFHIRPKRVLAADDYVVVEYVWSARHTGAFADGTPATDKSVSLPGAMLVRYQDDGLVDRVWVFQDWPNALQQLGLAPEIPADFKPFALPETAEIVTGPPVPSVRERYEAFLRRLGPDDYKTAIADDVSEDFTWIDLTSSGARAMLDGSTGNLALPRAKFLREGSKIETAFGVGSYFAAYVTNDLVYKGGFMGAPAEDQKITTHTLDIVRFDPHTLRFETLASYGNSYEILSALQLTAGAARPVSDTPRFGIGPCDDYVEDMRACISSLDGDKRMAAEKALAEQIVRWRDVRDDGARYDELGRQCVAAQKSARVGFGDICPRVEWE